MSSAGCKQSRALSPSKGHPRGQIAASRRSPLPFSLRPEPRVGKDCWPAPSAAYRRSRPRVSCLSPQQRRAVKLNPCHRFSSKTRISADQPPRRPRSRTPGCISSRLPASCDCRNHRYLFKRGDFDSLQRPTKSPGSPSHNPGKRKLCTPVSRSYSFPRLSLYLRR